MQDVSEQNGEEMAKTFTYTVKTPPRELLVVIKEKLKIQPDIKFSGDENSGQMKGKGFEGKYSITESSSETEVSLTIDKKPWPIPWGLIKSKIDAEAKNW